MTIVPIIKTDTKPGFVGLSLDPTHLRLPESIRFGAESFVPKDSFHVTLIGYGHAVVQRLVNAGVPSERAAKECFANACRRALQGLRFEVAVQPRFMHVRRRYEQPDPHDRQSIIAMCNVKGASEFQTRFWGMIGLYCQPAPYHVTLMTLSDPRSREGIGLVKEEHFQMNARDIEDPAFLEAMPKF